MWFQAYQAQSLLRHNENLLRHNELVNSLAGSHNRMSQRTHEVIKPLLGVNGRVPDNFPVTREELFLLTGEQCSLLLIAYNLPDRGTATVKRNRLAVHIGLIL